MLTELQAVLLLVLVPAVLALIVLAVPEEASPCADWCFRHQNRPRLHVPCDRCRDRH